MTKKNLIVDYAKTITDTDADKNRLIESLTKRAPDLDLPHDKRRGAHPEDEETQPHGKLREIIRGKIERGQ